MEQLKCEALSHDLANGHLVCNGIEIYSSCWTVCIEGYEKENAQIGSYVCQENGEWNGERTLCVRKDCRSFHQVTKTKNVIKYVWWVPKNIHNSLIKGFFGL